MDWNRSIGFLSSPLTLSLSLSILRRDSIIAHCQVCHRRLYGIT